MDVITHLHFGITVLAQHFLVMDQSMVPHEAVRDIEMTFAASMETLTLWNVGRKVDSPDEVATPIAAFLDVLALHQVVLDVRLGALKGTPVLKMCTWHLGILVQREEELVEGIVLGGNGGGEHGDGAKEAFFHPGPLRGFHVHFQILFHA